MSNDYKVIFLGNVDVGKTSTIIRFSEDKFYPSNIKREELDQITKEIKVGDQTVSIAVTDTAGQERFHTLTSSYYRNADVIIMVYDVTDPESFQDVEGYFTEGTRYSQRSLKYLIANKCDLEEKRKVSTDQGENLAAKLAIKYFETSALTGQNVQELFNAIAGDLLSWGESNSAEVKSQVVMLSGAEPKRDGNKKSFKCTI